MAYARSSSAERMVFSARHRSLAGAPGSPCLGGERRARTWRPLEAARPPVAAPSALPNPAQSSCPFTSHRSLTGCPPQELLRHDPRLSTLHRVVRLAGL